ncbi:MAG: dihydrofolate reductase family protein [Chitinophagaceae bacterium]
MRKVISFMHITVDGFVAGPNGEMDWINVDSEIFDYAGRVTDEADTALYGRVTFEMMDGYWPTAGDQPNASKHSIEHSKWYNSVTKVVISKTLDEKKFKNTKVIHNNIAEEIKKLKEQKGKNIQMFGSPRASQALMEHNLIDEYWLFVNPVLLGQGIQFFKDISDKINLKLIESKTFPSGVTCHRYEVAR